jgi:hypothetical protein
MLDIGVVMDPLASINLKKDTTLAMIRAAQLRGHRLWYLRQEDLFLHQGVATGAMRELRLTEPFVTALDPYTVPAGGSWHAVGEEQRRPLRELDVPARACGGRWRAGGQPAGQPARLQREGVRHQLPAVLPAAADLAPRRPDQGLRRRAR